MRKFANKIAAFLRSKRGNVAMIFAIALVPLMIGAGAGLDFARAMLVRQQMGEALDAAALAVGSSTGLTQATAQTLAQQYFNANYTVNQADYGAPIVSIPNAGYNSTGSVLITASDAMPTILMKLVGITTLPVSTSSTVVWGQTKLWVALVLDNTGSMSQTDASGTSKMSALKTASGQLLTILQHAAATPGDVQVSIVPFAKLVNVGTSNVNASWIDWTDWRAPPPTPASGAIPGSTGPGSACPWVRANDGFDCVTSPTSTTITQTVPSSGAYAGYICPSWVETYTSSGSLAGMGGHHFNGCYDSTPTNTLNTTTTVTTPTTLTQTCTQVGAGAVSCNAGSNATGASSSATTTTTTAGYSGNSTSTTNTSSTGAPTDGAKSCKAKKGVTTCTWTRTTVTTDVATTLVKTGAAPYSHTWTANPTSSWNGCIMDRTQSYDAQNTAPGAGSYFPAANDDSCPGTTVMTLNYDWTSLSNQITAMSPNGSTNQTIGLAHGWQTITPGSPYGAPALPPNTTPYIILVSDGLNTQDRWYGDGSAQATQVDTRMALACTNAKAAGVVIYTIFVDLGGTQGNSTVLQNCATDASKYFDLTTSNAIITTFNQIAQEITAVRVSR